MTTFQNNDNDTQQQTTRAADTFFSLLAMKTKAMKLQYFVKL